MSDARRSEPTSGLPRCPECGDAVRCGARLGEERCWCMDHPPLRPDPDLAGCLCPRCLARRLEAQGPEPW